MITCFPQPVPLTYGVNFPPKNLPSSPSQNALIFDEILPTSPKQTPLDRSDRKIEWQPPKTAAEATERREAYMAEMRQRMEGTFASRYGVLSDLISCVAKVICFTVLAAVYTVALPIASVAAAVSKDAAEWLRNTRLATTALPDDVRRPGSAKNLHPNSLISLSEYHALRQREDRSAHIVGSAGRMVYQILTNFALSPFIGLGTALSALPKVVRPLDLALGNKLPIERVPAQEGALGMVRHLECESQIKLRPDDVFCLVPVTTYLSPAGAAEYSISLKEGKLVTKDNLPYSTHGPAIYVWDKDKTLYIMKDSRNGSLKHSSLTGGFEVLCAGEIDVKNGEVEFINRKSGHYQPDREHLNSFANYLRENDVKVKIVDHGVLG